MGRAVQKLTSPTGSRPRAPCAASFFSLNLANSYPGKLFSSPKDVPFICHPEEFLMKKHFAAVMLVCVVWAAGIADKVGAETTESLIMSHQAQLVFDIDAHTVQITDHLVVPAGILDLRLGGTLTVESISLPDGKALDLAQVMTTDKDVDGPFLHIDLQACGFTSTGGELVLKYSGTFFESVENVVFSRENVGGEITATISSEGIYLSGMAEWLAWNGSVMLTHDLTFDTPAGFETVTQGERTEHEVRGDRLHTRWVAANPADGLNLIANKYFVHEEAVRDGVVSQTFLLEDDEKLRATYMERTKAYITMYEEMIGPYPYKKFATVENWFPTGYGMPSYTLLGGQVLRLPFIPYTSFGHEICHNWWGNSVFVDTSEGNWCEGLTVYCADYHYKELENEEQARQYRRTLLKDYAAYVRDPAKDFPLTEFINRHSGATRSVGYGKSMMVFHMVDRMIGREAFLKGMQAVAAEHKYIKTNWSDFFAAFEDASGQDLLIFKDQWLTRTGAPTLSVEDVKFDNNKVTFSLHQDGPAYDLLVPVVVTTKGGSEEHIVHFDKESDSFELKVSGARVLAVDPNTQLFRKLHQAEIEPTLSQVLAEDAPTVVLDNAPALMTDAARKFAEGFIEQDLYAFVEDGRLPADAKMGTGKSNVVINPGKELLAGYKNSELMISGKNFFLGGKRYSLDKFDLVFTAASPYDPTLTDLVILCNSPHRLEALARRLGHYGKYSYLVFPVGQGSPVKGNWQLSDSPMVVKNH
jgi:aminopeptidase N